MEVGIPKRALGSTGEMVSAIGLGGFHIGIQSTAAESVAIVRAGIDNGITFMDNCWDYNDGESEIRMGQALQDGYREKAFLMTKVDGRDKVTANKQIDESLRRLRTDVIDLLQLHEVIQQTDPDRIFAPGGAIEALLEARAAGKTRYIGFTGHKSPALMLRMVDLASEHGIRFDAVQMPLNIMDAHYDSFQNKVMPRLLDQNTGILAMKPMGNRIILDCHVVSAEECLRYAMSLPASVVITGCDSMAILHQAVEAGRWFSPLTDEEREEILNRTAGCGRAGEYEAYKTRDVFDATCRNPHWLGEVGV